MAIMGIRPKAGDLFVKGTTRTANVCRQNDGDSHIC
jgi:hypothetical protein